MKLKILAVLLFTASLGYSETSADVLKKSDELIRQKKYASAYQVLNAFDAGNSRPEIAVKKVDIALKYYVKSIMHEVFSFADLENGQSIEVLRDSDGEYSTFSLKVPEVMSNLMVKYPANGQLYYSLGNYYYEVHMKYPKNWLISDEAVLENSKQNFFKAAQLKVMDYFSLYALGVISILENNIKIGQKYLQDSLLLNPTNADANYNLAFIYFTGKDNQNGILYAKKAFDEYQDKYYKADAAKMLGNLNYNISNYAEAITNFKTGIDLNPTDYFNYSGLLKVYLAKKDMGKAGIEADKMFSLYAAHPNILQMILDDYSAEGQFAELEKFFDRNIRKTDNDEVLGDLYFYSASHYLNIKNNEKARECLTQAREHFSKVYPPEHQVFGVIDDTLSKLNGD